MAGAASCELASPPPGAGVRSPLSRCSSVTPSATRPETACCAGGPDLYGRHGGRADVQAVCPQTSAWLRGTVAERC